MIKIYIFNYDHDSNFTSDCDDNSYPWGGPACSQYVEKIPTKDTTQDDFWKIISEKLQTEPARQILGAMSEEDGTRQMKLYIPLDDDSAIQNWVEVMSNQKLLLLLWIPYHWGMDADSQHQVDVTGFRGLIEISSFVFIPIAFVLCHMY